MALCRELGWTYAEYRRTPAAVVRRFEAFLAEESRALKAKRELDRKMDEARGAHGRSH